MAKDTFYFSHDYNSRSDEKIKLLIRKHGIIGYGIFWAIVEDLYNNANALRLDSDGIAFDLRVDKNVIDSILNDFDLFVIKDGFFGSLSVERRLNERNQKSEKARESANKRWLTIKNDANAMRTQYDSNAIKESKENKSKVKENNRDAAKAATQKRISEFKESLYPYTKQKGGLYDSETVRQFFDYWSELNKSGTKMKWELKETFEISKRLATWVKNEDKFTKNGKNNTGISKPSEEEFLEFVQLGINNANRIIRDNNISR